MKIIKPVVKFPFPGPKTKKIVSEINKFAVPSTYAYPLAIKDGQGVYLKDADNNWFLDFNSNVCATPLGYRHPEILEVIADFSRNGAHKIAGQDFYTKEHAKLLSALLSITPSSFRKVFLSNTGAEAVENAIKFAYRRNGPKYGIACEKAFHGRTLGALTYTNSKAVHKKNYPSLTHLVIPFCREDDDEEINLIDDVVSETGKPAFVIVEGIQGEGGYRPASKKFIRKLASVANKNDFALIFDEVQSGMGRTGKWWSFEHFGVTPDIISVAKSLQVGATISNSKYATKEIGAVSSTWGGGSRIDMAIALKIIEIIKRENLVKQAKLKGRIISDLLFSMQKRHSIVTDSRGIGLMQAIEFTTSKIRDQVIQKALKKGLALLPCGEKTIRIAPPLIISEKEIYLGLQILEESLR